MWQGVLAYQVRMDPWHSGPPAVLGPCMAEAERRVPRVMPAKTTILPPESAIRWPTLRSDGQHG
jgi:hypothetical protein